MVKPQFYCDACSLLVRPGSVKVVDQPSPIVAAKAIKNAAELEGMKEAHLRDSVAICDFLAWLEKEVGKAHGQHGS